MTTNSVLLSTAYFPPVLWFRKAIEASQITIEACEHFKKQTWRNRCSILSANGELALTIPISKRSGEKMLITDVEISYETEWQRMHWNAIVSAYNKSPYFEHFAPDLVVFFTKEYQYLFEYNYLIIKTILQFFDIEIPVVQSTDFLIPEANFAFDYRYSISPKIQSTEPFMPYYQVFEHKYPFVPNLSVLDVLFNEGPDGILYLK